ncbi:MAG: DUF6282 family protein [Chloroflexota bacterium]|nr:DUF6282 family protein [Chloroflexota bacterium]
MAGAFDLHVHSYPSLFPRLDDDLGLAEAYRAAGFGGFALKGHHESTASRAYLLGRLFPDLRVGGGVVLNRFVGGLNPAAVEACLRTGGRIVWMPSIDADGHALAFGHTGGYDVQSAGLAGTARGISILDDAGELRGAVHEILDLVKAADAVLATAHLSAAEVATLVPVALARGVAKVVITHPFFKTPALDLETLADLVGRGAYAEFAYNTLSPMWQHTGIDRVRAAIGRVGAERCLLVSDGGQRHNPSPPEGLRIFAQSLFERGVGEDEIDLMIRANPRALLGLDGDG